MNSDLSELLLVYEKRKDVIKKRLSEFSRMMDCPDPVIFSELVFCLFTPQSSARKCDAAVRCLSDKGLIGCGCASDIADSICGVRFHHTKAKRVVLARELFTVDGEIRIKDKLLSFADGYSAREWLVANVNGLGYKEAGHFLRNIGLGFDLAILDRHILKNLVRYGAIDSMPKALSKRKYLEIEKKMIEFSERIGIPVAEIDLLFWSMEAGEVFK